MIAQASFDLVLTRRHRQEVLLCVVMAFYQFALVPVEMLLARRGRPRTAFEMPGDAEFMDVDTLAADMIWRGEREVNFLVMQHRFVYHNSGDNIENCMIFHHTSLDRSSILVKTRPMEHATMSVFTDYSTHGWVKVTCVHMSGNLAFREIFDRTDRLTFKRLAEIVADKMDRMPDYTCRITFCRAFSDIPLKPTELVWAHPPSTKLVRKKPASSRRG